ncbi:PIN domain-containing protein [Paratractidigestivibacter sp.]|uniref:PIN domain-containing protein n=1 Tax=Paratractidigestivibacter sp. TaxID=2847316 RepID=UPI002ABDF2F4|nr:PIN domain-containing protein [Paratractidigestivibacter sp.]
MVVIVDTNLARNENSYEWLLGYRDKLEGISSLANLLIPEVVIDEIVAQKHLAFEKEVAQLKRSGVLKLTDFLASKLDALSFDAVEAEIRNDKSIDYDVLPLPPADYVFPWLYKRAISHSAPFEEKSDKGFKDACIVASIEYYLEQRQGDEDVLLCTDDKRMASYFNGSEIVRVEDDLDKAKAILSPTQAPKPVLLGAPPVPDLGGQASVVDSAAIDSLVCELKNSPSFQVSHRIVGKLSEKSQAINERQELEILSAAMLNKQVFWILRDDDVCDFIKPIFLRRKDDLTDNDYRRFIDCFDLLDEREDERGEPFFTERERHDFRALVDAVEGHVRTKTFDAAIENDPQALLAKLNGLIDSHRLDDSLSSVKPLAGILIDGYVDVKPGPIPMSVVTGFRDMLAEASPRKREAIALNLTAHMRDIEIEDEIPF